MLHFPDSLTADEFLARHWQKRPLFMPAAVPDSLPRLSADELAWLATQDDVESRLVLTVRGKTGIRYAVEHGPFDDERLGRLPECDWTLLVQDVEKHLPDFRAWLAAVPFVPDWRIDDLMLSCAAPGGSVGPHRDHYDVFLCQMSGEREWRLADARQTVRAAAGGGLSLLEPWPHPERQLAGRADALYLPPGVPHWGVATDLCVTCSIGMRAPTWRELRSGMERELGVAAEPGQCSDIYYSDPDLRSDEAIAGLIHGRAIDRAAALLGDPADISRGALARAFGAVVTDPKAWLEPDVPEAAVVADLLRPDGRPSLAVHGMARLAWHAGASNALLFLNGHVRPLAADELSLVRALCSARHCDESLLAGLRERPDLFTFLLTRAAFAWADDD